MTTNTPKPPKMTAADLKYNYNLKNNGNFFDRESMKFFGDTMGNYYVPAARSTSLLTVATACSVTSYNVNALLKVA